MIASQRKNMPSIIENPYSTGSCALSPGLQRYSLKRSKFDKKVFYLQAACRAKPKPLKRTPSASSVIKEFGTSRTACSTQHSARVNQPLERSTAKEFQIEEYLKEMKKCMGFQFAKRSKNQVKKQPFLEMRKTSSIDATSNISLRRAIRPNFPIQSIRESVLSVHALNQPKEGTEPEQLYSLIEDQRFSLLKLATLSDEYVQLECVLKNGLIWAVNERNQLEVGFTLTGLDRMLTEHVPQPVYTRISRYGLMEYQEVTLAEPLTYSGCQSIHLALYHFLTKFADEASRTMDPTKKLWVRDCKGLLSFVQLQGLICHPPDRSELDALQSPTLSRKTSSKGSLHSYGSRLYRLPRT